jgi:hypothetical protein
MLFSDDCSRCLICAKVRFRVRRSDGTLGCSEPHHEHRVAVKARPRLVASLGRVVYVNGDGTRGCCERRRGQSSRQRHRRLGRGGRRQRRHGGSFKNGRPAAFVHELEALRFAARGRGTRQNKGRQKR